MTPTTDTDGLVERPFQHRVDDWMFACFGVEISGDKQERADRFIEEALELAQTMEGFDAARAHALVDYVFGRSTGERPQEVGGVMVTLAALCNAAKINMLDAGEAELARVWTKVEQIRAKQAAKPTGSALPVAADRIQSDAKRIAELEAKLAGKFSAVDEEVVVRAILRDRSLRHFRIVETPAETWVVMSDYNRSAIEDARAALSAIGAPKN